MPNASVTLVAAATGTSQRTNTTSAGEYTFPFLPPGVYQLTVEASGFQRHIQSGVTVSVAELTVVDVSLKLGETTQTVQVTGAAPLVQTETSSLGRAISNTMLESIPLSSRNFTQALALTPGVAAAQANAEELGRNSVNISANGARLYDNSMVFNGLQGDNVMAQGFDDAPGVWRKR